MAATVGGHQRGERGEENCALFIVSQRKRLKSRETSSGLHRAFPNKRKRTPLASCRSASNREMAHGRHDMRQPLDRRHSIMARDNCAHRITVIPWKIATVRAIGDQDFLLKYERHQRLTKMTVPSYGGCGCHIGLRSPIPRLYRVSR
jgi:hypothetical protein